MWPQPQHLPAYSPVVRPIRIHLRRIHVEEIPAEGFQDSRCRGEIQDPNRWFPVESRVKGSGIWGLGLEFS